MPFKVRLGFRDLADQGCRLSQNPCERLLSFRDRSVEWQIPSYHPEPGPPKYVKSWPKPIKNSPKGHDFTYCGGEAEPQALQNGCPRQCRMCTEEPQVWGPPSKAKAAGNRPWT